MTRRVLICLLAGICCATAATGIGRFPYGHRSASDAESNTVTRVDSVIDDSTFLLDGRVTVRTGAFTTFSGIEGVADLSSGDLVHVRGARVSPWAVVASRVAVFVDGGSVLIDTVGSIIDDSTFLFASQTTVTTDDSTLFTGIGGVSELGVGDLVRAEGDWAGPGIFAATGVELLQAALAPVTIEGTIALLIQPDVIILTNATSATVHPHTEYVNASGYADLSVGDEVRLTGVMDSGSLGMDVDTVERLQASGGEFISFAGTVLGLDLPDRVHLFDGATVAVTGDTDFFGFAAIEDLSAGDELWIEAMTTSDPDLFTALSVTLTNGDSGLVEFVSTIAAIFSPFSFGTADGHSVTVGSLTALEGFSSVTELVPGQTVFVSGTPGSAALAVDALRVVLMDGEDDGGNGGSHGSGLRVNVMGAIERMVPPRVFVIDGIVITVDKNTVWLNDLSGFDDLTVGVSVMAAVVFHEDGYLVAVEVRNLGQANAAPIFLSGVVDEKEPSNRFRLDSGEWIIIDESTVIDGDVDGASEIDQGMELFAECVAEGPDDYLALWVFVSDISSDLPFFGPENTETTEALVVLAEGVDAATVAARHGATILGTLPGNLVHLFSWTQPVTEAEMNILATDADVVDAEANYQFQDPETIRRHMPIADRAPSSVKYVAQGAVTQASIKSAHTRSLGEGTMVAVIDTGVDPFHPLLRQRLAPGGWDFVDGDDSPWETRDGEDQDGDSVIDEASGHGTFVAGLVLLAAPGTTVLPYRVLNDDGRGTTFVICEAVLAAVDRGADVINMSFMYTRRSRILDRILDEASQRGVVLVSGAGNEGMTSLPFPARDHRVLAVAAVDESGLLAPFSNFGPSVAIAAPGIDLYSGLLDGEFGTWSGTSMAAPLVSGAVALLRAVNPYLTPDQIVAALEQSAAPPPEGDDGPGLLQVSAALDLVPTLP